jgi:membrane associated rhomboid family serine protease
MDSLHDPKKTFAIVLVSMSILILTSFVFVGGLADQLRFSPEHLCLLYVTDYHVEDSTWVFDAQSSACGWALTVGSFDIIFAVCLVAVHYMFWKKGDTIPRQIVKLMAIAMAVWALISMITAATVSGGIGTF